MTRYITRFSGQVERHEDDESSSRVSQRGHLHTNTIFRSRTHTSSFSRCLVFCAATASCERRKSSFARFLASFRAALAASRPPRTTRVPPLNSSSPLPSPSPSAPWRWWSCPTACLTPNRNIRRHTGSGGPSSSLVVCPRPNICTPKTGRQFTWRV